MLTLKETNHSYYCECFESPRLTEYESWKDFTEEEGIRYDFDLNLLFRFDLKKQYDENGEDTEGYELRLHHALQRHGYDQWHAIIHNIKQEDLKEINEFLKDAKYHLMSMWEEIEE